MTTDRDMMDFVERTMDCALRDQNWLWLTDPDSPGFGTMFQIDHDLTEGLVPDSVWQAVQEVAGSELGFVYERRGPESLSPIDRQRLQAVRDGACAYGLRLRGPVLLHDTGARWLGPDDL